MGNIMKISKKNKNKNRTIISYSNLSSLYVYDENKVTILRIIFTTIFIIVLHTLAKTWKYVYQWVNGQIK